MKHTYDKQFWLSTYPEKKSPTINTYIISTIFFVDRGTQHTNVWIFNTIRADAGYTPSWNYIVGS